MNSSDECPADISAAQRRRAIFAAVIGNALEWYDFVVYAFLAGTIARLFFPAEDDLVSLLLALATFGVGFVMRPAGAIVLGAYADRAGRKKALMLTIMLMGLGTAIIAFTPTYASIGWWAPLLIVTARLIQGFSAGGELGAATTFMIEHAADGRRGLAASWQQSSQAATLLAGTLIAASVSGAMSREAFEAWGWRLPFLIGLLIVPVGLYIRRQIGETPAFTKLGGGNRSNPMVDLVRGHGPQVISGIGLVIVWTVSMYFFVVYMPTYAQRQLGLPQSATLLANGVALVAMIILAPIMGSVSDRIGRKPLLMLGSASVLIATYPLVALLAASPTVTTLIGVQLIMAILISIITGPAPAALAELYPTSVRSSGMSIAYNSAVTIFGGFAPFISTWLIARTGSNLAPAYYVISAAAISLAALLFMRESARDRAA